MPRKRSIPKTLHRAGELRHEPTPAEAKLWAYLRQMREDGVRFRRQHAIGSYITDFCSPKEKLIIELDGSGHLVQEDYDAKRTEFLASRGYKVVRFLNSDVMNNVEAVKQSIHEVLAGGL